MFSYRESYKLINRIAFEIGLYLKRYYVWVITDYAVDRNLIKIPHSVHVYSFINLGRINI